MNTIEIKRRWTNAVLFSYSVPDDAPRPMRIAIMAAARAGRDPAKLREERGEVESQLASNRGLLKSEIAARKELVAVIDAEIISPRPRADLADAYLVGAYLADANLADANLARANLVGANLVGAYLADANLARANLADANLARADLVGAYLADANLARAYLADANLARAYLADANLARANLVGANLVGAYLAGAKNRPASIADHKDPVEPYRRPTTDAEIEQARIEHMQRYRARHPQVPVVENLDQRILAEVTKEGQRLEMRSWHGVEAENGTACGELREELAKALERLRVAEVVRDDARAASQRYLDEKREMLEGRLEAQRNLGDAQLRAQRSYVEGWKKGVLESMDKLTAYVYSVGLPGESYRKSIELLNILFQHPPKRAPENAIVSEGPVTATISTDDGTIVRAHVRMDSEPSESEVPHPRDLESPHGGDE